MPNLLTLDASTEVCSVAICHGDKLLLRECREPRSHAKVLLPMVDELLRESGLSLQQLEAIGVSSGPGSFTGIRIGLGVAQGLAYGAQLPLVAIDSLAILAHTYLQTTDSLPENALVIPAFDARMKEVYWAGFEWRDDLLFERYPPSVCAPEQLLERLQNIENRRLVGVGHGWQVTATNSLTVSDPELKPSASAMLTLVAEQLGVAKKQRDDKTPLQNASVEPVYLRNEITWEKRKRIRTP